MLDLNRIFKLDRLWENSLKGNLKSKDKDKHFSNTRKKPAPARTQGEAQAQDVPNNQTTETTENNTRRNTRRRLRRKYSVTSLKAKLLKRSGYFRTDSSKRIDYVLVTTNEICAAAENNAKIRQFLNSLIEYGVDFEIDFGQTYEEYLFIKINISDSGVIHLANLYHTELSCDNIYYCRESKPMFKFLETELDNFEQSPLLARAPESISDTKPETATNAERAMLLGRLMNETSYGSEPNEFGLSDMLKNKLFIAAYTLHEGPYSWTNTEPLSDRQLLCRFWANFRMLFKRQPLNLIEKYFGTEVGMYFAWMEYYVKFLIPASIVGVISSIIGAINTYITDREQVTDEVCNSKLIMCPYCEHFSLCPFSPLKNECDFARLGFLLDNPATVFFSMFMSVWATVFMVMWKRRLSKLKLRWNVLNLHVEETIRQQYIYQATSTRISKATGEEQPYIPNYRHCPQIVLTNATVLFCALVVFAVALSVIVYQYKMRYVANISQDIHTSRNASWMASITGSLFVGLSILVFMEMYERIAYWLTVKECPRTQETFDQAFVVKNCLLNFSNSYAAITYLAFFKGKFFTYPGDSYRWNVLGGILTDQCGPGGCLADVGIQLATVLIVPSFLSCLNQIIKPYLMLKLKHYSNIFYREDISQWELDFYLQNTHKYYMFNEYRDLLIQYGYITCFVCALPFAPLLALIRNIFEIRIDAKKFLKYQKRHIACKVDGLGAYNDILTWITYISVITNACVIAFSSNFIPRTIYRLHENTNLNGYVNKSLSVFDTNDYKRTSEYNSTTNISKCYYHGMRYPPEHSRKYELRDDYFYQLVGQFSFVLIFEHVIILVKLLLVSTIREIPRYVREKLRMEEYAVRIARKKTPNDAYKRKFSQLFVKPINLPRKSIV